MGSEIEVPQVDQLRVRPAFHNGGPVHMPAILLLIQLPAHEKAGEDGPSSWAPASQGAGVRGIPGHCGLAQHRLLRLPEE